FRKLLVAAAIVLFTVSCLQIAWHVFQGSQLAEETLWQRPPAAIAAPEKNSSAPQPQGGSMGKAEPSPAATLAPLPLVAPAPGAAPDAAPAGRAGGNSSPNSATEPAPPAPPPSAAAPALAPNAAPVVSPAPAAPRPPSQSPSPNAADPTGSLPPAMPLVSS